MKFKITFLMLLSITLLSCRTTIEESNINEIKPIGPSTYFAEIPNNGKGKKEVTLNFLMGMNFMLKEVSLGENSRTIISLGTIELDTVAVNTIVLKNTYGFAKRVRIQNRTGDTITLFDVNGREINSNLKKKNFEPITDPFPIKGMFTYLADAPLFVECSSKMKFPVTMEKDYISLEREYLSNREEPGKELLVTLTGRIVSRPKMEGNGEILTLVVDKFDKAWPKRDCQSSLSTASLINTYWKLIEIYEKVITVEEGEREPHFVLKADGKNVKGFSGCNNFTSTFEFKESRISFGPIAGTRKFCKKQMELENFFLKVFSEVNNYKVFEEKVEFYKDEEMIAKFKSVYF